MLSTQELMALLSVLDEHTVPFDMVSERLLRSHAKADYFRVGSALYLLIQNRVLSLGSSLNAYYVLWAMYKNEALPSNPFFPIFWMPLNFPIPTERNFLLLILNNAAPSMKDISAADFMQRGPEELPPISVTHADIAGLIKANQNRLPSATTAFTRMGITPPVVDDPDDLALFRSDFSPSNPDSARQEVIHTLLASHTLQPAYLRPPPPLLKPSSGEMLWLNPEEERTPLWMYSDSNKELMLQAIAAPLSSEDADTLRKRVKEDPKIAVEVLSPLKLPSLVENNVSVAAEVLHQLITTSSDKGEPYLSALTDMPITLHSIETINELSSLTPLPGSFLQAFISKCIDTCHSLKDRGAQNRMIRLVSVFLQSLVKKKSDIKALNATIQNFCVEYCSNKEAAALFKLLKDHST